MLQTEFINIVLTLLLCYKNSLDNVYKSVNVLWHYNFYCIKINLKVLDYDFTNLLTKVWWSITYMFLFGFD